MSNYATRYFELTDRRDAINAQIAPLQAQLDAANAVAIEAQANANAIAAEINTIRGGRDWLDLKTEIAQLTRALGKIPARPVAEEAAGQ